MTYEAFGAVGDGKTDDFDAITKTHAYANATGQSVFANETASKSRFKYSIFPFDINFVFLSYDFNF